MACDAPPSSRHSRAYARALRCCASCAPSSADGARAGRLSGSRPASPAQPLVTISSRREQAYSFYMARDSDRLELVLQCLKVMESTLLGLRKLQQLAPRGQQKEKLDSLIKEDETQIADVKRKMIQ